MYVYLYVYLQTYTLTFIFIFLFIAWCNHIHYNYLEQNFWNWNSKHSSESVEASVIDGNEYEVLKHIWSDDWVSDWLIDWDHERHIFSWPIDLKVKHGVSTVQWNSSHKGPANFSRCTLARILTSATLLWRSTSASRQQYR